MRTTLPRNPCASSQTANPTIMRSSEMSKFSGRSLSLTRQKCPSNNSASLRESISSKYTKYLPGEGFSTRFTLEERGKRKRGGTKVTSRPSVSKKGRPSVGLTESPPSFVLALRSAAMFVQEPIILGDLNQ